jgi:rod shape-determining protein MreC
MENLLLFFKRFGLFIQFLALEIVAIVLLVSFNGYQRSVFMSSAGWLSGSLYETVDAVSGYFHLREVNEALSAENARLKNELARYRHQDDMAMVSAVDSLYLTAADTAYWQPYRYVSARIIQHSINKAQNYITINKGTEAGIQPDMGVVSAQGVVGIVKSVSKHYAVVMPLLNVQSRISCKLDSSKNFGSLIWDSADYRYATMQEVPGHVQVIPGETVSTSGFSAIFPAGIPVGKVVDVEINNENSFLEIQLELAVDFSKIDMVHVIQFGGRDELKNL